MVGLYWWLWLSRYTLEYYKKILLFHAMSCSAARYILCIIYALLSVSFISIAAQNWKIGTWTDNSRVRISCHGDASSCSLCASCLCICLSLWFDADFASDTACSPEAMAWPPSPGFGSQSESSGHHSSNISCCFTNATAVTRLSSSCIGLHHSCK